MNPGPKPTITGDALAACAARYMAGTARAHLARLYRVHPTTITRVMAAAGYRRGRIRRGRSPRVAALASKARALRAKHKTLKQIGAALGISFGRVGQLLREGPLTGEQPLQ